MNRVAKIAVLLFGLVFASGLARAQNLYSGNPADAALLEAGFSNPALNASIRDRFGLAMTSHHSGVAGGFLKVRSGIITYHFPWSVRGLGVGAQFFNAGLYSNTDIRLAYGTWVIRNLAAGASFDVIRRSFDRSQFVDFDPNDPVFADGDGKTSASLGLGLLFKASRAISLGVDFEHLNRPNLAMGAGNFRQPMMVSFGIKWFGSQVNGVSMLSPVRVDNYSSQGLSDASERLASAPLAGVEIPIERATLRASVDAVNATVEAEAPVYSSVFVNYRYAYGLTPINAASTGTHRFGLMVDFNRMPVLSSFPVLPALPRIESAIEPLPVSPRGYFVVYADTDSMSRLRLDIRRDIEEGVLPNSLSLLLPEDIGDLRASMNPSRLTELSLLDARDPASKLQGLYSPGYRGALEGIGLMMRQDESAPRTELLTYPGAEQRANALLNVLTGDHIAVKSRVPLYSTESGPQTGTDFETRAATAIGTDEMLSPKQVIFHIVPVARSFAGSQWTLEIRDQSEHLIRAFSGVDRPPDSIAWNWQDSNGNFISAGTYNYLLRVRDGQDLTEFSSRGQIQVVSQHRSVSIEVRRTPRIDQVQADRYMLIVGPHGSAGETLRADKPPQK